MMAVPNLQLIPGKKASVSDFAAQNMMTIISGKNTNIISALAVSLLLHVAAFGVAAALKSKVQSDLAKEYIPVELVQLPSPSSYVTPAPPVKHRSVTPNPPQASAPEVKKDRAESITPVATSAVPQQQSKPEVPASGSQMQPRSAAAPGGGTSVNVTPSSQFGTGAPQPEIRGKGSYQAFHRLTRLPSFRLRAEPVYPNPERMAGNEARVMTEIYLDERGKVDDVIIKKSGGKLFDKAVIDAARQSSFLPGYMGEKAVPTVIQIPYVFKLK